MKTLLAILATISLSGCAAAGWIGMHGTVIAEVTAGAAAVNQAESLYLNTHTIIQEEAKK